jgi:Zn-dependent peptidase ImmA (M78 family)/DNA-binding XRE family transcriptional regulator
VQINGDMLVLAREYRGLTQEQAALLAGCAQSTIAKVEAGLRSELEDEYVIKLSAQLDFPIAFFQQKDELLGFGSSAYFYRKRASIPASERKKVHSSVNLLRIAVRKVLPLVEIKPSRELPRMSVEEYNNDPASVARALRAFWKMPDGPVKDLTALVESAGVLVLTYDFGTKAVDATSLQLTDMPPLLFAHQGVPGDRWRFTIAHELAHLVMHDVPHEAMEQEADIFASEFLVPENELRPQLLKIGTLGLKELVALKRYWRVSMQMLIQCAKRIGFINDKKVTQLMILMNKFHMRIEEPEPISRETPSNFQRMLEALTNSLKFSAEDVLTLVNWGPKELSRFFSLDVAPPPRLRLIS